MWLFQLGKGLLYTRRKMGCILRFKVKKRTEPYLDGKELVSDENHQKRNTPARKV